MVKLVCIIVLSLLQIASQGILKYCLRGLLAKKQRTTLYFFLDVIARVLQEKHEKSTLQKPDEVMNTTLALLERDFPVSTKVSLIMYV